MRVVIFHTQHQKLLPLPATELVSAEHVENLIKPYFSSFYPTCKLCVDFCGEYIPLADQSEARIISRLAAAYHNLCVKERYNIEPTEIFSQQNNDTEEYFSCSNSDSDDSWDEEVHGSRLVFDETYEQNADIECRTRRVDQDVEEIFGLW